MSNGFGEEYDKNGVLLYKGYWMYNEKKKYLNLFKNKIVY